MLNLLQNAFINLMDVDDVLAWSVIAVSIIVLIILIGINIYVSRIRKQIREEELLQELEQAENSEVSDIALSEEEILPEEELIRLDNEEELLEEQSNEDLVEGDETTEDTLDEDETYELNLELTEENNINIEDDNIESKKAEMEALVAATKQEPTIETNEVEIIENEKESEENEAEVKEKKIIDSVNAAEVQKEDEVEEPNELYIFEPDGNKIKTKVKRLNSKK